MRVPAYLSGRGGSREVVALPITTEKVGGTVLVRIGQIGHKAAPGA